MGYGICHVPAASGCHHLNCVTWRPRATLWQRWIGRFVGGGPQLRAPEAADVVAGGANRCRLQTEAAGTVQLELGVLTRHLGAFGVEC
ncbi:B9D2 protein, partial [Bucorvus abyssinicus]|nr:B9D2 protein [Bucorvus abyssinicus]